MENIMIAFEVNDMTCGHCVGAIEKSIKAVDSEAKVDIDLARHLVQIHPVGAGMRTLGDAIRQAGYTPVPTAPGAAPVTAGKSGCCCGG
jgi:copper chaperone